MSTMSIPTGIVRDYCAPMLSSKAADWGNVRATIIRRPRTKAVTQRFRLPWHVFRLGISGGFEEGSTTRLGGFPRSPLLAHRGCVAFYPAETDILNEITIGSATTYMTVEIEPRFVDGVPGLNLVALAPIDLLASPLSLAILQSLKREIERPGSSQLLFAETAALMLVVDAARHSTGLTGVYPDSPTAGALAGRQLATVTNYMVDHLADEISLIELARLIDVSAPHLCRAFKASTGTTPHRWQVGARVDKAQELMMTTDLGLAAVALATGFADQSHFTTAFRRVTGETPGAWRRSRLS